MAVHWVWSAMAKIVGFSVICNPPGVLIGPACPVALDMLGIFVGICIDDDVFQAQILAGIHDTNCDLAPIGDENLSLPVVTHIFGGIRSCLMPFLLLKGRRVCLGEWR